MISILWLTGGHGFIGSHLINKLSKDYSLKVYCLENKQIAFPQVIRTESGRTCVSLNFKDKNHLSWLTNSSDVQKPNYLLLLGWSAVNYPTSTVHQTENVESTFLIYEATPKTLLRKVLFFGSIDEYGSRLNEIEEGDVAIPPIYEYAKGKTLVGKKLKELSLALNIDFQHLFISNVYGSRQRPTSLLNCMMKSDSFTFSGGNYYRDYLHVTDLCEIIRSLLYTKSSLDLNVGSGVATHSYDFVRMAWKLMSKDPLRLNFIEPEFRHTSNEKRLNISRLKAQIPTELEIDDIQSGLIKTVSEFSLELPVKDNL